MTAPTTRETADCICVTRGTGPEGCGACNETGVRTADHIGEADEKVTADHAELARLVEAATQGHWKACGTIYEHMNCEVRSGAKGEGQAIAQVWDGPNAFKDGQFIAAANPATVLALLSEIAALRGEVVRAKERMHAAIDKARDEEVAAQNAELRTIQAGRQRDELRKALEPFADIGGRYRTGGLRQDIESRSPSLMRLLDFKAFRHADSLLANQGAD